MDTPDPIGYGCESVRSDTSRSIVGWLFDLCPIGLLFIPYVIRVVTAVDIYLGGGTWAELQHANRQGRILLVLPGVILLIGSSVEIVLGRTIGIIASRINTRSMIAVLRIRLPWLLALGCVALASQSQLYAWDGRRIWMYVAWIAVAVALIAEMFSLSKVLRARTFDRPG